MATDAVDVKLTELREKGYSVLMTKNLTGTRLITLHKNGEHHSDGFLLDGLTKYQYNKNFLSCLNKLEKEFKE